MSLPNVSIQYQNGGLGLVAAQADRVVGLILTGIGFQNTPLLVPRQLFSLADFDAWMTSVTATGEFVTEARAQVADFYAEAGTGAELWVMFVVNTVTMATVFTNGQASVLLDAAAGRLNVVAVSHFQSGEVEADVVKLDGLAADTLNAMDEAQAMALDYANRYMPVRFILDGRYLATDISTLRDLKTQTFNRVAVCVATKTPNAVNACLGLLLGRIAAIPVNRSIGRVKDGSVFTSEAYLTNKQTVAAFGNKATALHDKGYIFLRKFPNRAGFYWNDDHMACGDTDDYYSLANGRVIDKVARIAYATFVEELMDTVVIDKDTGKIIASTIKMYQVEIERAIKLQMVANDEISDVRALVDPDQYVIGTSQLIIDLRITPTGTNRVIIVKLGLYNPNAA